MHHVQRSIRESTCNAAEQELACPKSYGQQVFRMINSPPVTRSEQGHQHQKMMPRHTSCHAGKKSIQQTQSTDKTFIDS